MLSRYPTLCLTLSTRGNSAQFRGNSATFQSYPRKSATFSRFVRAFQFCENSVHFQNLNSPRFFHDRPRADVFGRAQTYLESSRTFLDDRGRRAAQSRKCLDDFSTIVRARTFSEERRRIWSHRERFWTIADATPSREMGHR